MFHQHEFKNNEELIMDLESQLAIFVHEIIKFHSDSSDKINQSFFEYDSIIYLDDKLIQFLLSHDIFIIDLQLVDFFLRLLSDI